MSTGHDNGLPAERGAGRVPVTLRTLEQMARDGEPFACLTAYDSTTARWLERGGVHLLLVGDSAANVVLGFERTVEMPLDLLIALTAAVKRGAPNTVVMADMPFMSYHADDKEGVRNAGRFLAEGGADIVKVEADGSYTETVRRIVRAGIPVCAHIGTRPQAAALTSGPKASGRTKEEAARVVEDAVRLEEAGASMLLIEAVLPEVTEAVMDRTSAPLIGIGAGTACHGQILVVHDLLGLTDTPPRFAEPVESLGPRVRSAAETWVRKVGERSIGGRAYTMRGADSIAKGAGS